MTGFAKDPMSSTGLQRSTNVIKGPGAPQLSGGRQGATTPQVAPAAPATATPEGVQQVAGKMPQPGLPGPGKIYRPGEGPVTGQVSAQPPNIVPSPTHPFPAQADQPHAMPPAPFGPPHGYKQVMATVGDAAKAVAETMHSWKPAAFQHGSTVDLSDVSRSTRVDSKLSPGGDSSEFFRKRSETAEEMAEDMDMDASRHSEIFKLPRQRGRFARGYRTQGSRLLKKRSDLGGTVPQPATATAKTTPVAGDQDEDGEDLGMDLFMLGREVQSGLTLQDVLNKAAADRPLSPQFGLNSPYAGYGRTPPSLGVPYEPTYNPNFPPNYITGPVPAHQSQLSADDNVAPSLRDLSPYTQQIRDNPQMMEQLRDMWRTGYDKLNPDEYNRGRGLTEIYGNRNGELSQDPWGALREHLRSYAPQYGLPDDSAQAGHVAADLQQQAMDDLSDYSRLRHPPDQRVGPPPQDYTPASLDGSLPAAPPSPAASPDYFQPQDDLTNFLPSPDIQLQSPSGMPAPTPAQMQPSPQPGRQSAEGGLPYLDTARNMGLESRDQAASLLSDFDGATQMPGEPGSQYLDAAKQQGLNMRQDMQPYADAAKDLPNYGEHYLDTAKNMGLEARNRAMQFSGLDPSNMSNQGPSQPQPQPSTQPPGSPSEQSFDLPEQLIAGEPPSPPPPVADESGYFGTKSPSSLANLEIPEVQLQMRPRSVEEAASQVAKQLPEAAKPGLSQPQLPTASPQQPSSARSWINAPPVPPEARSPKPAPANVAKVVSQPSQVSESFGPVGRAPANVGPFDHLIAKARQAGNMNEVQRLQGLTQDTQRHGQEWAQRDPTFNGRMDWYQQQSNNAAAGQPRFQGVAARPPMPKAPQLSSGNPIAGAPTPAKMPAPSMGSNHPAGPAKPSLPKAAGLGTSISNALQAGGQAIKRRAPALLQNDMVRDTAVGGSIGAASDLYNYTQGNDYHAHALAGAGLGLGRKPVSYLIGKAAPAVEPLVQKGRKWFQSPGMLEDALGNPISPLPSAAGATFTRGAQAAGNATRAAGRAAGNVAQAVAGSPVGSAIGSAAKGMARDTAMGGVLGGMTGGAMDLYNYASGNPYQGNAANMAGYGAIGGATAGAGRQALKGLGAGPEAQRFGASLMGVGGAAVPAGHAAMAEAKRQMADEGVRTAINVRTRLGGAQLTPEAQQEIANMAAQGDVAGAVDKVLEGVDPATVAKTEMGKALQDPATQQQMVAALFGDKAGALFGAIKAKVDAGDLQGAIQLGWGALPLPAKVAIAAGGVMGGYGLLKTFLGQSGGMAATLGGAGIAGLGLAGGLVHHANPEWFKSMAPESLQELFQAFQSPAAPAAPPPTAPAPAARLPINAVDGPDTLARAAGTLA